MFDNYPASQRQVGSFPFPNPTRKAFRDVGNQSYPHENTWPEKKSLGMHKPSQTRPTTQQREYKAMPRDEFLLRVRKNEAHSTEDARHQTRSSALPIESSPSLPRAHEIPEAQPRVSLRTELSPIHPVHNRRPSFRNLTRGVVPSLRKPFPSATRSRSNRSGFFSSSPGSLATSYAASMRSMESSPGRRRPRNDVPKRNEDSASSMKPIPSMKPPKSPHPLSNRAEPIDLTHPAIHDPSQCCSKPLSSKEPLQSPRMLSNRVEPIASCLPLHIEKSPKSHRSTNLEKKKLTPSMEPLQSPQLLSHRVEPIASCPALHIDPSPKSCSSKITRESTAVDRIEKSRESTDANPENIKLVGLDDLVFGQKSPHAHSSPCNSNRRETHVQDRIECTREDLDWTEVDNQNNHSKESIVWGEINDEHLPQSQIDTLDTTEFLMESNNFISQDSNRIEDRREIFQDNSLLSQEEEIAMTSLQDPKVARSVHSQEFQLLRREHSKYFRSIVAKIDATEPSRSQHTGTMFVVRSRALLDSEAQRGNFSILDIPQGSSKTLALYETNLLPDQMALDLKAHIFQFDAVFSEKASFDEFYSRTVQENVQNAMNGGTGAIFLCGNDEFGKSCTMSDIEERVVFDLFSDPLTSTRSISVQYLGLGSCNELCIDLLSPVHHFVQVVKSTEGKFHAAGATETNISSAKSLLDMLCRVKQRLSTERILRRESESLSYSFCRITICNQTDTEGGVLYLVTCPSSDDISSVRRTDSNDDSYRESNSPLANVMEMIHTKNIMHTQQPCTLTRLLGSSFAASNEPPRVCLVAAVSPSSEDTEVTLRTMLAMKECKVASKDIGRNTSDSELGDQELVQKPDSKQEVKVSKTVADSSRKNPIHKNSNQEDSLMLPRQWPRSKVTSWLHQKKLADAEVLVGKEELCGKTLMNMTKVQLREHFYPSGDEAKAHRLFRALRAEHDRIARLRVKRKFAQRAKEKS